MSNSEYIMNWKELFFSNNEDNINLAFALRIEEFTDKIELSVSDIENFYNEGPIEFNTRLDRIIRCFKCVNETRSILVNLMLDLTGVFIELYEKDVKK